MVLRLCSRYYGEVDTVTNLNSSTPAPTRERLAIVDILRGFALFGILVVNITTFRSGNPAWSGIEWVVDRLTLALAQGKFVLVYSFLFGLGFALQLEHAADRPYMARYFRRLLGLLLLGIAHFVLLWEGDILLSYVLPGLLLLLFARRRPQTALKWGFGLYAAYLGLILVIVTAQALHGPAATPAATAAAVEPGSVPPALLLTSSYGELVSTRWRILPDFLSEHSLGAIFALGIFLLGFYAGRQRLLSDSENHLPLLRRVFAGGLALGLVTAPAYVFISFYQKSLVLRLRLLGFVAAFTSPIALCLAYVAAMTLAAPALVRRLPWLAAGMQAAGRMSLTNYLMQSLILTTLFYGYGLGWYGRVAPVAGVALAGVIYAGQLVFSFFWLRVFRFGPVEWLWRSLTYWRVQPMRVALSTLLIHKGVTKYDN